MGCLRCEHELAEHRGGNLCLHRGCICRHYERRAPWWLRLTNRIFGG